jgi:predicted neutral ceramidase superfamily lipid hydrolase
MFWPSELCVTSKRKFVCTIIFQILNMFHLLDLYLGYNSWIKNSIEVRVQQFWRDFFGIYEENAETQCTNLVTRYCHWSVFRVQSVRSITSYLLYFILYFMAVRCILMWGFCSHSGTAEDSNLLQCPRRLKSLSILMLSSHLCPPMPRLPHMISFFQLFTLIYCIISHMFYHSVRVGN